MKKRVFKKDQSSAINPELEALEKVAEKKNELIKKEEEIISNIRGGFKKRVVVFVDLVNSTKFKVENTSEPEKWILRLKQFSEIIKEFIEECGGTVVKYIGDELMGMFDRETKINDAINLIMRVKEMEKTLTDITTESTKVKIAIDYGDVYMMAFEGHNENDPQGTPIDRCARIAKFCQPSTILTSYEFVSNTDYPKQWYEIGEVDMKGLGITKVYQYMEDSIQIETNVVITKKKHDELHHEIQDLKSDLQDITLKQRDCESKNKELVKSLEEKGTDVTDELVVAEDSTQENEADETWEKARQQIVELKNLITDAGVSTHEYARFLFLYMKGEHDRWDHFAGKTFEGTLEKGLIKEEGNNFYSLDADHRRNERAIIIMNEIEGYLKTYEEEYRDEDDAGDLFTYSLEDPDFWYKYVRIGVS